MTPSSESLALIKWSKPGIIYVARNRVNGKMYVGQTRNGLSRRFIEHKHGARNGALTIFHAAIRKHGIDSFDIAAVQTCSDMSCLNQAEKWWIYQLRSMVPNGYNLTDGGWNGSLSEETRRKISEKAKGRIISEETRRKISLTHTGMKRRPGTGEAISRSLKGKARPASTGDKNHFFGKEHSEESRAKIGAKTKERMTPEMRARIGNSRIGKKLSAEHLKNMIEGMKRNAKRGKENANFGRVVSDKQREAISNSLKGIPKSPEHRAKIGAAHKGRPSPLRGRTLPQELKNRLSKIRKEYWDRKKGQMGLRF